jgi:hypothetical protein
VADRRPVADLPASALIIFGLMAILFRLSLFDAPDEQNARDG